MKEKKLLETSYTHQRNKYKCVCVCVCVCVAGV